MGRGRKSWLMPKKSSKQGGIPLDSHDGPHPLDNPRMSRNRSGGDVIFIHICKCGGTSINTALGKNKLKRYVPEDKMWVGAEWEKKYRALIHTKGHFTALAAKRDLGDQVFQEKFKFTFVRNPWDRLVSAFVYGIRNLSFKGWLIKGIDDLHYDGRYKSKLHNIHRLNCLDWITDEKGEIIVDFIGSFENFREDFGIICDNLGIPRQRLPRMNSSRHAHYSKYYDDETRQIVAEKYAKDIEYFGYEFNKST